VASRSRVISFDADQTLIDFRPAMREALDLALSTIRDAVPQASLLSVDDLVATRNAVAADAGPNVTMETIRFQAFERTLAQLGADRHLAVDITRNYLDNRFRLARVYDDVKPTLDVLRGDYTLCLASNGNSYPERSGLDGYFDVVVLAQEIGVRKPDPHFFEILCREVRRNPPEITHVGDSLTEDIHPANVAGLRTVWINRDRRAASSVRPWAEIQTLDELIEVVR
jgi:putative hydrolase of the HAD superfamily